MLLRARGSHGANLPTTPATHDPFSLFLNREANVVVIDEKFSSTLRASVMDEIRLNATQLDPSDWQKRGWIVRINAWLAYGFARWVMGWLGFGKRWD